MQTLNPATMNLASSALIEASAGTGKTYTITALYLRYLLGLYTLKDGSAGEPLTVEQILVVTFTEAATSEIKDRVSKRIEQAKIILLGGEDADSTLVDMLAQVEDKQQSYQRLDLATKSLDDAAIFTIHGFCQRMLKQHAFESNLAFNLNFILDETELKREAAYDFWRSFVYPLQPWQAQAVLEHFSGPLAVLKEVSGLLANPQLHIEPHYDNPQAELTKLWEDFELYLDKLPEFKQKLREQYLDVITQAGLKGNLKPGHKANIQGLTDFAKNNESILSIGSANNTWELWGSATLSDPKYYKKNVEPLAHRLLLEFDEMHKLASAIAQPLRHVLIHLSRDYMGRHIKQQKQQQHLLSPDDLLQGLYNALQADKSGALQAQIQQLFPVAMIDEFQDTDPVQYGIFNTLFSCENAERLSALTMIGDPKQAIYGFRGADIFTYIGAKKALPESQHFTLVKNFRSDENLVNAVNALFEKNSNSFIYDDAIRFSAVAANGKNGALHCEQYPLSPLEFIAHPSDEPLSKDNIQQALGGAFADHISHLLTLAQAGELTLGESPVKAGDFCVLVRDRNEAAVMKKQLSSRGVASVYLARESVFKQNIATHLYRLMKVLHGAYDERAMRGILVGPFFNLSAARLMQVSDDQQQWQEYVEVFVALRKLWFKEGVLAMVEHLIRENSLLVQWRQSHADSLRSITDLRHLGEVLQHKQLELDGPARLLHFFQGQITQTVSESDSAQLRLESDDNLVQIVTMHASKGLEYPLVFIPFAVSYRDTKQAKFHKDGKQCLDLAAQEQSIELAHKEQLAEDLRLMYVALTRPIFYCAMGVSDLKANRQSVTHKSALGYLLFNGEPQSDYYQSLTSWVQQQPHIGVRSSADIDSSVMNLLENDTPEYQVREQTAYIERNWRSTSFSALSFKKHIDNEVILTQGGDDEDHRLNLYLNGEQSETDYLNPYDFPKGPNPGSCLHDILETTDFARLANNDAEQLTALNTSIEKHLDKYAIEQQWQPLLSRWMTNIVKCPLDKNIGLSLAALKQDDYYAEMEFHLPLQSLQADKFNQVMISLFDYDFKFDFEQIQGVLKGFIDLLFCYQGRYYVLDYKSNHLGNSPDDYNDSALTQAMNSHQYHVQAAIYMVALHRLLKSTLDDYQPSEHLGGCYYTFLRAMEQEKGVYYRDFSEQEIELLDSLFAQGEQP